MSEGSECAPYRGTRRTRSPVSRPVLTPQELRRRGVGAAGAWEGGGGSWILAAMVGGVADFHPRWGDRLAPRRRSPVEPAPQRGRLDLGPGWPWPMVFGLVVLLSALLAWFGAHRSGLLGELFPVGYSAACIAGACAVRRDGVLIPAAQPPVVATIAVVAAAVALGATTSTTTFLLEVLAPLAELFWWIVLATAACVVVAVLGVARRRRSRRERRVPGLALQPGSDLRRHRARRHLSPGCGRRPRRRRPPRRPGRGDPAHPL